MGQARNNMIAGLVLVIIGVIFLLHNFGILPDYFTMSKLWPVFVIVAGIWFLMKKS